MELDSFTKKILERTEARQESLNKLISTKQDRQPFSQKPENIDETNDAAEEDKLSKILFLSRPNDTHEAKENEMQFSPPKTPLRGLAALRQTKFGDGPDPSLSQIRRQELEETDKKVAQPAKQKGLNLRLAALASQINQWDSRSASSTPTNSFMHSPLKSENISAAAKELARKLSSSCPTIVNPEVQPSPQRTDLTPHMCAQEKNIGDLSASPKNIPIPPPFPKHVPARSLPKDPKVLGSTPLPTETVMKSPAKPPRSVQTPLKKIAWDQAVVETLESQGFTKSPSASKLMYAYSHNSVKSRIEDYETANSSGISREVEQRETMKEKKPELLTVAQKAALFSKGGSATPIFPKHPFSHPSAPSACEPSDNSMPTGLMTPSASGPKVTRTPSGNSVNATSVDNRSVGLKRVSSNSGDQEFGHSSKRSSGSSGFTSKVVPSSPVKNLGEHTRHMHEVLLSQVPASSCSELAMKQKLERQEEMDALRDRWNRGTCSTPREQSPHYSVNANEPDCDEEWQDNLEEESLEEPSFSREANSICRHMDEMLDEAIDDETSALDMTDAPTEDSYSHLDVNSQKDISSQSSNFIPFIEPDTPQSPPYQREGNMLYPDLTPHFEDITPKSAPSQCEGKRLYPILTPDCEPSVHRRDEEHVTMKDDLQLIHTISFYRRQKQECATPPVKCIVRREQVISPISPQTAPSVDVGTQIKSFQEELYKQDVLMRQASQVVALCAATPEFHSSPQHVEGEKLLLVSTLRRQALKQEIVRLKTEAAFGSGSGKDIGILTISEMRLPLKREFLSDLLERKRFYQNSVHHFFCLLKYREKVISTEMLTTSDGITAGTLCFTNHICLQSLGGNFHVIFEVYALETNHEVQEKKASTKKDQSKVRLTPKLKKSEPKMLLSPATSAPVGVENIRTSNFGLVGQARFSLENCHQRCFSLDKVPAVSPLEGRLDVKLELHANVSLEEKGFLTIFEDISGFGAWHRRWFVLSHSKLSYWKYPEEETKKDPMGSIDLKQCISPDVCLVSRDICARPNTFQLLCIRPQSRKDLNSLVTQSHNSYTTIKYLMSADTKEERIVWCKRLTEALTTLRMWNTNALRPIDIRS